MQVATAAAARAQGQLEQASGEVSALQRELHSLQTRVLSQTAGQQVKIHSFGPRLKFTVTVTVTVTVIVTVTVTVTVTVIVTMLFRRTEA